MSHVTCNFFSNFFSDKVVELVGRGSVINGGWRMADGGWRMEGHESSPKITSMRVISACHQAKKQELELQDVISVCCQCVTSGKKARTPTLRCNQCVSSVHVTRLESQNSNYKMSTTVSEAAGYAY